jgi:hypothetical protein
MILTEEDVEQLICRGRIPTQTGSEARSEERVHRSRLAL